MYKIIIPACRPIRSFNCPINKENMAPPAIPVHRIPANEPWNFETLLSASEKTMAYITDKQNPSAGKPNKAIAALPKSVSVRMMIAVAVNNRSTILLSMIFNKPMPRTQPTVIMPQNNPTVSDPFNSGLKPW